MSMKSGSDSPPETDPPAQSAAVPCDVSSSSNTPSVGTNSLDLSGHKIGDLKNIKKAVNNQLVNISEESGHQLSDAGKETIQRFVDQISLGFAATMTMICGPKCSFISACPIKQSGAPLPYGKRCPVESSIIAVWVNKHLKALGIEDYDDPAHSFDLDLLYELAGQELIRWRCGVHLSDDPELVTNQLVGYSVNGEAIFSDVINPVLDVMERAGRNVAKIREALLATRKSQIEAGRNTLDPSQKASDLRAKAQKIAARRKLAQEQIKDVEYEVKDTKDE